MIKPQGGCGSASTHSRSLYMVWLLKIRKYPHKRAIIYSTANMLYTGNIETGDEIGRQILITQTVASDDVLRSWRLISLGVNHTLVCPG